MECIILICILLIRTEGMLIVNIKYLYRTSRKFNTAQSFQDKQIKLHQTFFFTLTFIFLLIFFLLDFYTCTYLDYVLVCKYFLSFFCIVYREFIYVICVFIYVCVRTGIFKCVCVCMEIYISMVYVYIHRCTYIYIYVCAYLYLYIYGQVYAHICVQIYIYMLGHHLVDSYSVVAVVLVFQVLTS